MPVTVLEIENFKSYGGKHVIGPFSDHLTSIIGPNGCGKSNLMDAISFVFGLHASSLRSHQLKDLIYRGATLQDGGHLALHNDDDDEEIDTTKSKRATGKRKKKDAKNTPAGKLKCSVTLVYEEDNDRKEEDESEASGTEIRFTRTILPNGSCEYFVNHRARSRIEYEEALNDIGVLVNVRNCFVFQGDVENLARKNPVEMISLFEQMSGSIEYKKEYDTLFQQKEELEQQQKLIVQQKKVHEYERQQYKTQKLEADKFHDLVQQRDETQSDFYLWQLYHLDQDRIEKEQAAIAIQEQLQDATQNESKIQQQVHDHKKEITKLRRATNQAEKHNMKQATVYDQYEPSRIQIAEEIANLQKKLEQDQKLLQKKVEEESKHEERLQKIEQDILEYQQTDLDLTNEYEEEKSKLLSTIPGGSLSAAPLTAQQEDEYVALRELANQASVEPRRILQQQQRKYESSQNALAQVTAECEEVQKSLQQVQQDVTQLTDRSDAMSKNVETNRIEVQETEKALIEVQSVYQQNQKRCEELDGQIEQLDLQLRDMKNRTRQSKDEERFVQAIQTLQTNFVGVFGRLQDLCSPTQRKYSTAVTVAAGKDMDAIVVSNSEVGFECIKYLREQRIGIATFLPLDKIQVPSTETVEHIRSRISADERYRLAMDVIQCSDEAIQRAVLYAVGTTVVCDDLDSARELCFGNPQQQRQQRRHAQPSDPSSLSQMRMKAVTLGGAVISKAGTMTGGNSNDDQSDGRWKNQDMEKLRAKKEELEGERSQFDHVGTSGVGYASQIEQLRMKLGNLKNREQYTKSEFEYTKKNMKEKEVLLQSLKKQLSRLQKKVLNSEKENEKCSKSVKGAANAVKAAEDVHLAPFREATGLRDLNLYETTIGQYRDEYQKKKRAVLEHITQLEQQKEFEIGRDLKQPIVKVEQRIQERTESLRKAEQRRDELQKKVEIAKQHCEDAEAKYQKAVQEEKEYETIVQDIQSTYTEAQNATMKYKKLLHQEESMLEKLRSKLHETLQRARVDKVELPLIAENDSEDPNINAPGGRSTRSSRRGSGRGQRSGGNELVLEGSDVATATQDTSSRGITQYSQEDHPIMVRDQEKASQVDFSKLSDQFKRRLGDREEKKLQKDFEEKIQRLVSEIESIAPNMKADEAFTAASQRLKESKIDIEKAKESAIKAAQAFSKIKAKRTKCFMDAYNHIEESLKTIYTDMTKSSKHPLGGNAYLSLDDIEEPYKGGLKFNAMPPMKRFRDMEQLSGGEKTVAALSLLFAIHSYHPAPFFVMDEVDAALDNINLRKVCNYICQRSRTDFQCIVISLKDMFYEHSDHLIGIYRDLNTNSSNTLTLDLTQYDPPHLETSTSSSTSRATANKRRRSQNDMDHSNLARSGHRGRSGRSSMPQ